MVLMWGTYRSGVTRTGPGCPMAGRTHGEGCARPCQGSVQTSGLRDQGGSRRPRSSRFAASQYPKTTNPIERFFRTFASLVSVGDALGVDR
jgi:hypothetical protein